MKSENKATFCKLSLCKRNKKVHEDRTRFVTFKLNEKKAKAKKIFDFNESKGKSLMIDELFMLENEDFMEKKCESSIESSANDRWQAIRRGYISRLSCSIAFARCHYHNEYSVENIFNF